MPDGNWVLTDDDMTVELQFVKKGIQGLEVQRTTKYSNYNFEDIEPSISSGLKGNVIKEANMLNNEWILNASEFPSQRKESNMDVFMNRIEQIPGSNMSSVRKP